MRKNGIMQKLLCGLVLCAALLGSSAAGALLPYPARLMKVSAAEPVMLWDETESLWESGHPPPRGRNMFPSVRRPLSFRSVKSVSFL